ncbi:MAG: glycosyltransferase [Polyangiaceae bacterium]
MRIAYVDHSYHATTRSSDFFRDALLVGHDVEVFLDDRWNGGLAVDVDRIVGGGYDLVIVWQMELVAEDLARRGVPFVFVPMWDSCRGLSDVWWRKLRTARVVSFAHALHERVSDLGVESIAVRYFPDPDAAGPPVTFDGLRAFFWQRSQPTCETVEKLFAKSGLEAMHVHLASDPHVNPSTLSNPRDHFAGVPVSTSRWFADRPEMLARLRRSNVYVAPRLAEGIGFSFLEAMSLGMCVVAADAPTMNEYVTHGVSGLLFDPWNPRPLDLSRAEELGRRAREKVILGRARWLADVGRLREFVFSSSHVHRSSVSGYDFFRGPSTVVGDGAHRARPARSADVPKVTIATVTRNCVDTLGATLGNVLEQDYPNLEVLVVDGGSTDGTLDVVRAHADRIDRWVSEPDGGPYHAMNRAAELATGDYVLFMNSGDWFVGADAVSRAFRYAPKDADFVFGHHVYRRLDGVYELHRAADFESTWNHLRSGPLDGRWLGGVPGHQATFTRTSLLRSEKYDTRYRIAADHAFMYLQRSRGAKFHHTDELLSVYVGGGMSWRRRTECAAEWRAIAAEYGPPKEVATFFDAVDASMSRRKAYALREEIRRLDDVHTIRRSGLFDEPWYRLRYGIEAGDDPIRDYLEFGVAQGRNPAPWFDTRFYMLHCPDVVEAKIQPFLHFVLYGSAEGRPPSQDMAPPTPRPGGRGSRRERSLAVARSLANVDTLRGTLAIEARDWLGRFRSRGWALKLRAERLFSAR